MAVPYTFANIPNGNAIPLSYLDANFNYLTSSPAFSGNVTIGGTLGVTGNTSLGGTLGVTGNTSIGGTLGVSGNVSFSGTFGVVGALTLGTQQTTQGSIILANTAAGAYSTTIKSSNFASAAWTFTLPPTSGTNGYILTTNGSGVSAWTNPTALGIDLDVGSTAVTNGTTGRVLYDNAGVLGEYSFVPVSFGGTGQTTLTQYGLLLGNATNGINAMSAGSAGQIVTSSGASANPVWTTATFPSTATGTGSILRADGTNWSATTATYPTTTAAGSILASGSANTVSGTTTPVLGIAGTSAGNIGLSGATSGVVTLQTAAIAGTWSLTLPTTGGTNKYALTTDGSGVSSWSQIDLTAAVTGVLPVANGGTSASSAGITAFNNITGYTASGATGTTSTNLVFSGSPTITTPGIVGVSDASNATAGNVGQVISGKVLAASAVSLTTATAKDVVSISLTAGDWDVTGNIAFVAAGTTTISAIAAGMNTTSATFVTDSSDNGFPYSNIAATLTTGSTNRLAIPRWRVNVNTTTTVYLIAQASFATSTMTAYGSIIARRIR